MEEINYNLDWKDKKILRELDINARQSFSEIARKTRISKQTVIYRINNLVKTGIIKQFITYIDSKSLKYTFYDIFFKIKYCTTKEEKNLIELIKKVPEAGWFVSSRGEWNLIICLMAEDPIKFNSYLENILEILGDKVIDYDFFIVIDASQMLYKEILGELSDKFKQTYLGKDLDIKLKISDYKILRGLAVNSRIPLIDLAEKLKLSIEGVRYSIKKLENLGIIQAYKPLLDISKLGYLWNIILIKFNYCTENKKEEFIEFLKSQKQVFYLVNGVGNWEMMIETHTRNIQELEEMRKLIASKFENIIRDERVIQVIKEHKCVFIPTA